MGGWRSRGGRLSRHPLHRDARIARAPRGHALRVGAQREGRARGRDRRRHGRRTQPRDHEARGRQRGRRPAHVRVQHGCQRGSRHPGRRRPLVLLVPERAGLAHLRGLRTHPLPRRSRLAGGVRHDETRLRGLRGVRHPRHAPRDHARGAYPHDGLRNGRSR